MKNAKQEEKPQVLGDYMIKETLGKGTFGKVKLGIYAPSNDKMAVKILEKSKMKEKDDYERVIREMEIIKQFNNENVVKVFEILEDREKYYIIMEYCEEGELFNYIVKRKRLSEEECAFFFYQIINGLESIHRLNIVHRDLKPENLLLNKERKLKIIDFGLSNFFSSDGNLLSTPCGSPCYASPEMVAGKKYKGFQIDVWSTGIILFAMICSYLPFEDPDNEKLFQKILECNLTFPPHVSSLVKETVRRILVTDPEKRIQINEIKKHQFYLLGKSVYTNKFPPPKTDRSDNERRSSLSSGISDCLKPIKSISNKFSATSTHHQSGSLNFNNFISSLSPKESQKYDVVNTAGNNTSMKNTKNDLLKYSDYNYQITENNKISLTSIGLKNLNNFNNKKNNFSTDTTNIKNRNVSLNRADDFGGSIVETGQINTIKKHVPLFKKNLNIETGKRPIVKDTVSFFSLDFNLPPHTNKNIKGNKMLDFNSTKNKFVKDHLMNGTLKTEGRKILPSIIKNEFEANKNKRKITESRNLYINTDTSNGEHLKNNSINLNKRTNNTNLHTSKFSSNLKFDKFITSQISSNSNQLTSTFNKFKDKINNLYSKNFFTNLGGVKS